MQYTQKEELVKKLSITIDSTELADVIHTLTFPKLKLLNLEKNSWKILPFT